MENLFYMLFTIVKYFGIGLALGFGIGQINKAMEKKTPSRDKKKLGRRVLLLAAALNLLFTILTEGLDFGTLTLGFIFSVFMLWGGLVAFEWRAIIPQEFLQPKYFQ